MIPICAGKVSMKIRYASYFNLFVMFIMLVVFVLARDRLLLYMYVLCINNVAEGNVFVDGNLEPIL